MARDPTPTVPREVLAAFRCDGASAQRLDGGLVNRHWLVTNGDGGLVIRQYTAMRTVAGVAWEQALVEFAAKREWPVARPITAESGLKVFEHGGRLWAAAPYLDGEAGEHESPGRLYIEGQLLARLHNDLADFDVDGQRPDFGKTWELDEYLAPAGLGSFDDVVAAFGRQYPELAALVTRERYRSLRELSRLHYPDLPDLPIHGDFHRSNLLWTDGGLGGLLDFDFARRDALVCDIAPLLNPFRPLDVRLVTALLAGYQSVRPLSDREWELLPALVRASLLWWLAWLLLKWRERGGEPEGIAHILTVRLAAWNAAEPAFRALRLAL